MMLRETNFTGISSPRASSVLWRRRGQMTCRPRRTDQLRSAENGKSEDSVYNLYQDCILASLYTQHPELKVVGEEGELDMSGVDKSMVIR